VDAFLRNPRFEYYRGVIESLGGDSAAARRHWESAAGGRGAFAVLSARKLGRQNSSEPARGSGRRSDGSVDQGIALMAAGSDAEARQALVEVLRAPDRNLSHYLARTALAGELK